MDIESLAAAAAELAERLAILATAEALPGDSAVAYIEHRAECIDLAALLSFGLQFTDVPA